MPKPFLIGVEVEESQVGAIIRRLNHMPGVAGIHLNLDQDKAVKPKLNGSGKTPGLRGALLRALADGKPQSDADLQKTVGISGKQWRHVAGNARSAGLTRKPTPRSWAITPKGKAWLEKRAEG